MISKRIKKRLVRVTLLAIASCLALAFFGLMEVALRPSAFYSGLLLYGLIFLLALYNLRKRIRFLPIFSSESWLQIHIYVGLFTGVLFGIHISWHMPRGTFEIILAGLYLTTFFSGIVGLILSRSFPKRLATRGNEVLFSRIPARLAELKQEVETIVMACLAQTDSSSIPSFYADRLRPFFDRPRHVFQHVVHSHRPKTALLNEIKGFERYVSPAEKLTLETLSVKVSEKDDLDYQHALQLVLRIWLFVHVPVTYALLVFSTIHLMLVFAFAGRVG